MCLSLNQILIGTYYQYLLFSLNTSVSIGPYGDIAIENIKIVCIGFGNTADIG